MKKVNSSPPPAATHGTQADPARYPHKLSFFFVFHRDLDAHHEEPGSKSRALLHVCDWHIRRA